MHSSAEAAALEQTALQSKERKVFREYKQGVYIENKNILKRNGQCYDQKKKEKQR